MSLSCSFLAVLLLISTSYKKSVSSTNASLYSGDDTNGGPPKPLYFAFMTAFSGSFVSSGTIPAVDLAVERVNNDSLLLQNYKLHYNMAIDTECDRSTSLTAFFNMVRSVPPHPLAILGMGCAVATEPVAEINDNWQLPMMGYVAAAPSLSDRSLFKSYYRTYPSDANFVPALMSLIEFYKWKKLLIITENANTFITNDRMLKNLLPAKGVYISPESITFIIDETDNTVEQKIEQIVTDRDTDDSHIIFVNTFETKARVILCKFYRLGLTTKNFVFITHGWYQTRWWSESMPCSDAEMIKMLQGVIAVHQFPIARNNSIPTASGLSADEFGHFYRKRLLQHPSLNYQFEATYAFDAVWALALAMDNASWSLSSGDIGYCNNTRVTENIPLENYTFYNDRIECLLNRSLNNMEFEGVSGYVQFDENGTRVQNDVFIQQYRRDEHSSNELSRVIFGVIHSHNNNSFTYVANETNSSVWPDGIPPDGIPIKVFHGAQIAVTIYLDILAVIGIIFALSCLAFNVVFRNRRIVKLTSPLLNYFTVVGGIMLYLSVIAYTLPGFSDDINKIKCFAGSGFFAVGYTVAFSAVLTKMYRVYYIFHNPSLGKKVLKDWYLLLAACVIIAVTIILIIIENTVSEIRPNPTEVPDRERGQAINAQNVTVNYCVFSCGGFEFSQKIFQIIILVYLLILQVVGIMFAIQTRKVKVKVLNDAKWIAAIIYSSSLCVIVIILSKFTLTGFLNTETALVNTVVLLATTIFLALAFVPKMVNLYQDPDGEKVFQKSGSLTFATSRGSITKTERKLSMAAFGYNDEKYDLEQQVEELEQKNKALEAKLMKCICNEESTINEPTSASSSENTKL